MKRKTWVVFGCAQMVGFVFARFFDVAIVKLTGMALLLPASLLPVFMSATDAGGWDRISHSSALEIVVGLLCAGCNAMVWRSTAKIVRDAI